MAGRGRRGRGVAVVSTAWAGEGSCHQAFSPSAKPRPSADGGWWLGVRSEENQCPLAGGHPGTHFPKQQAPGPFAPPHSHWETPPSATRELGRCRGSPHRDLQVTSAGNPSRPLSPHSLWLLTDGWGRGQAAQSQWPGNPRSGSTEDGNKIAISALGAAGRGCHSPACTEGLGEGCA